MPVLVDSTIWSLTFRRNAPADLHRDAMSQLAVAREIRMIGVIRQECLSGIGNKNQFSALRDHLRPFPDIELERDDFELAASFFNTCRAKGIQGSHNDFLICAVAHRLRLSIYTTDKDFDRYAAHIPIKRFNP